MNPFRAPINKGHPPADPEHRLITQSKSWLSNSLTLLERCDVMSIPNSAITSTAWGRTPRGMVSGGKSLKPISKIVVNQSFGHLTPG
jgi:hypothetical protein